MLLWGGSGMDRGLCIEVSAANMAYVQHVAYGGRGVIFLRVWSMGMR